MLLFAMKDDGSRPVEYIWEIAEIPKIEVDIMNVHYKDYYNDASGKVAPTDTQSPNPLPFLTVKDTVFQFTFGSKESSINDYSINDKLLLDWIKEAFSVHGIGAKTAVGYGRLNIVN